MVRGGTYDEVAERRVIEGELGDSTSAPLSQHLGCAVAAPHTDSLRKYLLQLRRRAASDQRSDQRQRVVVEIRLHRPITASLGTAAANHSADTRHETTRHVLASTDTS